MDQEQLRLSASPTKLAEEQEIQEIVGRCRTSSAARELHVNQMLIAGTHEVLLKQRSVALAKEKAELLKLDAKEQATF